MENNHKKRQFTHANFYYFCALDLKGMSFAADSQ